MTKELLDTYGRWTVIKRMPPAPRRACAPTWSRGRVQVRCVCGIEKTVWVEDLIGGRSNGCRSADCRVAWQALILLRPEIESAFIRDVRVRSRVAAIVQQWPKKLREHRESEARRLIEEELSGDDLSFGGRDEMDESEIEDWVDEGLEMVEPENDVGEMRRKSVNR